MSAFTDAHLGHIEIVNDHHGYCAGRTATCSCGWASGELREREAQALIDHWKHLTETKERAG